MEDIDLSLDPPHAYIFTGELCTKAYRLNRFAFDLKYPAVRERFRQCPDALMGEYELSEQEKALINARNWTGLVAYGGHMLGITKVANAVGQSHLHIGAHMCDRSWDEFRKSLPREISLMPEDI